MTSRQSVHFYRKKAKPVSESSENAKFPTKSLRERYGIAKSVVYNRLDTLGIKPQRQGNRSYINALQLTLMDDLNSHLKAGGRTEEFVQQCLVNGRIIPAQTEAMITQAQVCEMSASQPQSLAATDEIDPEFSGRDMVAALQAQKGEEVQFTDIQKAHQRAQQRAFARAAAEETLTLIYEATEEFTIPGLKEQLEQHRAACRQAESKRAAAHNVNDFLSKSIAFCRMAATNGSTGSATSSNNQ